MGSAARDSIVMRRLRDLPLPRCIILSTIILSVGCSPAAVSTTPSPNVPQPAAETESSFSSQLAAVRARESDIVHLETIALGDDDLDLLADVPGLKILQLDHAENRITAAGIAKIARLPNLEHLRIRGGKIDDEGLTLLAEMQNLKLLNLPQGKFTDQGLARLKRLPQLTMLRIGSPQVTDGGVAMLKDFPALRRIHLIDIPLTGRGLAHLQSMPRLESLYLDGAKVTDKALDELFQNRPDLHVHLNQLHHDHDPHKGDHPH